MPKRLKPSEILTAFSTAKAHAAKHATSQIIELVNAEDHTTRVSSTVPLHQPLFEAIPAEVWIDEYTPFEPLSLKLRFRNCDTVVRRLKIEPPRSPIFRVRPWEAGNKDKTSKPDRVDGKVAAGMEIAFVLEFFPQEVTDYSLDLVCCTERERFLLPVRVRGRFAALDLSDELEIGICPVKMPTTRVLTVRNVGTRGSSFAFQTSEHFRVTPPSATLAQGAAVQLELSLVPPNLDSGEGELEVKDDSGQTAVVQLAGRVVNVDVFLSQPLVEPNATYLSLSSRKTVKICNESEFTLEFSWKSFADCIQEEGERSNLLEELSRMETAEHEQLQLQLQDVEDHVDLGSPQSPFDVRKTLETKYRHLRKATLDDSMQFVDACFSITPLSGRVWAHSEVDVVVCFTPEVARLYSCCAFLEIAGQAARLPLQLRGQGIGPKAKVVYNELLDFGDVFIDDERTRDFTIQNKGEIPAEFELIPLTMPPGTSLTVHPSRGTLAVNEMLKIEVTFCSQELGEAFYHIRFGMQGSDEQLAARFKANVIPPVFHFEVDQVDFGAVSYSFPQTRTVKLINASKIAMKYSLRVPEEASYKQKEMELIPSEGKLDAYGEQQITIRFTSHNVKVYQYQLVVGVPGVGADLLSIPVRAQCFVPEITVLQHELDFGRCFLRYPHKQMLVLENKSTHLFGRFDISEQDEHSRAIATYSASEFSGSVSPGERVSVEISLSCEKLGSIRLPMVITVPGSTDLPLSVTLSAAGSGPKVELDQPEINWGNCSCLVDHERTLRMTNGSLIPAAYKTFIRGARSKFQIDQKEGVLMAGESLDFVLVANLDDTVVFKDQLHILITEGDNLVVPLSIRGTGTTMWSPSELRVVDFSHQMTSKECEWSCTLENKGKRVQVLTWINKTVAVANRKLSSTDQGTSKMSRTGQDNQSTAKSSKMSSNNRSGNNGATDGRDEVIPVFSVFPGTIELKPRTACIFVFKGLSSTTGLIQEELVCETRVGKEKVNRIAFVTAIRANFVDPKLTPSSSLLSFEYIHHPGNQIATQSQPLSLTNACELPLSFTLRTQTPFALDCWEAVLQPGEKVDLNVEFYPGFKDDYTCRVINGKVLVSYTGHPQKDSVELVGDISFPNLSFETAKIDFGCTLNDTQKSISMNVTNISKVDTSFRWIFIEDEKEALSTATAKKPYIPINQVFDILPIRGTLKPNESEKIDFVYYGHANRKFRSTVACEVEGGPEYELTLLGEASSLVYKLDKQSLDFGQVLYNKTEDRDFSILNVGKVPFSFNIVIDNITCGRTLEISPTSGKIPPNEKQRILVRLRPGIPEYFEETVVLEIAHFQPIPFKLFGTGTFAAVSLNLPRENHPTSVVRGEAPKWKELKKRAKQRTTKATAKPSRPPSSTSDAKAHKKRGTEVFPFILSQFVLDFGNVVVGTHKIKRFSVTNIGHGPASFQLDKNLATSRGFQIEPERVVRLPEKQSVEFSVTFHARKNIEMGLHVAQLPIVIKNGPPCIAMVRALVTVPDISIFTESLDFGKIAVSTCHTMFTQLQNVSAVPAEWAFKKPMGSTKDVGNFRFSPQSGVLSPRAKANIQIEFVPDSGRQFMLKLPIKINSNPKTRLGFEIVGIRREFTLFGRGVCGVPTINSDPRNVFMHRVKSRPEGGFVQKKFVISRNQFEFGPLIIANQQAKAPQTEREFIEWQKASPNNVEVFRMSNTSKFPIQLEFGMEKQGDDTFVVFPPALEIKEEAVHEFPLQIEFSDAESALQVSDRNRMVELTLRGEAYKIDVSSFDNESGEVPSQAMPRAAVNTVAGDGNLDFGLVRVGEKHSRAFNIRNRGKYSIKYIIGIRSAATRECFMIEPSEMVLEPGQSSSVNVTFTSKSEVTLRDCKDIKCTIIEMLSGEVCREFYVHTSARSVFSQFRLQPNRGINFGPHKYNDQAQTKRIEIRNDGEFPFKFRVQASRPATARDKSDTLTIDTPLSPSTLSLGQFAISPDCGTVDPGVTMGLDVVFQPKECAVYSETLVIEISGRNAEDAAETNMLLYELIGESCYPGINTTDYESIFEEQTVIRSLGVDSATRMSSLRTSSLSSSIQAVTFAEKEKMFSFGPLIAAANWKGTVERFKISNPMKVSSTVQFSIASSSSGESEGGSPAFTVQPAVWEIPPLEHRFVSVYFRPSTIALFHATFRAIVDDSPPQSSAVDKLLEFEMRGEGTMPCVTVTEPTVRDSTGALVVDFGRVRTSKAKDMRLALRNDGILPATVLFSIQANPNFLFALGNGSVVVAPKATEALTLQFRPQKVHDEPTVSQLKITVQNNPFEETTFKLFGSGYREDLVLEDLPRGYDDELHFDDIRLPDANETQDEALSSSGAALLLKDTKVFSLCNQSSDIQLELQEMFWYFKIPHFQVSQLFLFVGTTTEPRVALDRGSVNFNTLMIGTKTSQSISLVNQEHIPFNFVFDKTSLDFAGEVPALVVHPLSGVIPPNSRTVIEIEFIPTEEKSYNFNLNCIIKRKPTRLSLNVKGEGYSIHDALTLTSDDQNESWPLIPGPGNVLDFGAVRVNEEAQRFVVIHNSGKFNFDFNWTVTKQTAAFSIEPVQGTIKKNDKTTCRLSFAPTKQTSLDGMQVTCSVAGSHSYALALHGNAVPPMLQFSFTSHDFGPCFIAENDSVPMAETATLTVFNMDAESGIDLDCLFEKKPHLRVDCPPTVLGPQETVNITIVFTARHEAAYLEVIPFTINGSSTVNVSIRGEGVFPKVELVNSSMQMVVLGNLQIGQQISRTVKIANRSKRKTFAEYVDSPQPGVASLDALGISVFPQQEISLRAKESADIEFLFAPTQRIPSFQKDVFIRMSGSTKKLLTLSGCCQGIEVILETDTLSYGPVCLGSQLVRKVRLQNRGDVPTKFQWNVREFAPDFLVSPSEGMVAPNQHKIIEVTFKPAAVNPDIRYERVTCMIEGTAPATLTLVGSCVPQATSSIQDVQFDSSVRQETHKVVVIENTTASPWNLFPVVQGDHWSCPENVLVPAHGKANLDVLYSPLTMTKQNSQEEFDEQRPAVHNGSIFLAIPDGSALLYNLFGKASAPLPTAAISLSAAAKKTLSISIPIKNWLKTPQPFAVQIQKPPGKESVVVQGPSSILLHAGVTRNYNMKFFCYTEGTVHLSVRLVNQESGEYIVQDVNVSISKAVDVDTLYFEAPVRQSVKKMVAIENPFDSQRPINFVDKVHWWKCSSPAIRVRQLSEISGRSEGHYEIEYRPTLHSETPSEDRLTISFVELGEYTYNLVLSTQSVGPERILYFKAPLGGSQTQTFTFTSFAVAAAELSCSVQDPTSFSVPATCKVEGSSSWEGKPESVLVKFEPEAIGEFRDTLTLFSDTIGEYKSTLQGLSVPPLPQGPYVFSTTQDIEFKNVFSTPKEFEIMVDNPRFVLSTTSLSIPAKASKSITVKVDATASSATSEKTAQVKGTSTVGVLSGGKNDMIS
ncbi:hypothetical protein JG687_00001491 [Phytophthora cactorum]|uniref:Hydrocephalus-inducing protein n=1 Tax=Phytophthora cactorum TaxID=29920 RepID=A0A8T1UXQ9_9STRA|nr:hypothetical protein JG687_00001491 [Phytophthora cactorum]